MGSHLAEAKDGVGEDQFLSLVEEVSLEGLLRRLLGEETAGVVLAGLTGHLEKCEIRQRLLEPATGFLLRIPHTAPSRTRGYV